RVAHLPFPDGAEPTYILLPWSLLRANSFDQVCRPGPDFDRLPNVVGDSIEPLLPFPSYKHRSISWLIVVSPRSPGHYKDIPGRSSRPTVRPPRDGHQEPRRRAIRPQGGGDDGRGPGEARAGRRGGQAEGLAEWRRSEPDPLPVGDSAESPTLDVGSEWQPIQPQARWHIRHYPE